jgi:tRNA dimethylallyltransferase
VEERKKQFSPLPNLVVILGPTASGKSALGIALALRWQGEIVSADSRQVYRGLDIGTAKVTPEERALVPHHLLDVAEPNDVYTVSQFQQDAMAAIHTILAHNHQPFLVGGSPHYIQTVVDHFDMPHIPPQPKLRLQLETQPLADLLKQLETLDPQSAASIDRNNPRRVIRALEVCLVSGQPFSQQRRVAAPIFRCLLLGIEWQREVLYKRIDRRIDERVQQGLIEEIQRLLACGVSHERLDALGLEYRFVSRFLRGEFTNEAEMVQRLKYASHDFTRRQLSWFRRDQRIRWLVGREEAGNDVSMIEEANQLVYAFLQETPIPDDK